MFRFSSTFRQQQTPKQLTNLLNVVINKKVPLKPDDIFKLCVTVNGKDGQQLGLLENKPFVSSLRDFAAQNISSFSPFQLNQVKEMCAKAEIDFELKEESSKAPQQQQQQQQQQQKSNTSNNNNNNQTVGEKLWDSSTISKEEEVSSSIDLSTTSSSSSTIQNLHVDAPYQIDENTDPKVLQDIMDVLFVAKKTFDERNTYDLRKVQSVCNCGDDGSSGSPSSSSSRNSQQQPHDLMALIPWLNAKPLRYIIKTLAHINHQDYKLAQKLSRRICELSSTLTTTQCTILLGQLYRLKVQDSLTIIVRKIENDANGLGLAELLNIMHAAHAQTHVSAALQPLVGRSLIEISGRVGQRDMSIFQLVQCVEVAAKFGQASNPHVKLIVEGAARRASEMNDRQLAATLQNANAMKLISAEVFAGLHARAVVLVPSDQGMDVKYLEALLDVFSLLPFNSTPFMDAMLLRLSDDAGKLHVHNLVSVIELVASYPGAKGSTAVPALALAASMRKELLDQPSLISVVLSLAQLAQLSDEFFDLMEFLCSDQRKGFKQGGELVELLGFLANDGTWKKTPDFTTRFVPLFMRAATDLIPSLSQEDTIEMQQLLAALGIEDRGLGRRLISRLESLNVEKAEAERAANLAAMRRINNPNQQQQLNQNQHQQNTGMEWDAVRQQNAHRPQQQQQQQQRQVDYSGWGSSSNVPQQKQQQNQQQRPSQQQQQHQQQQGNRPMSSRELAAMSKQKQQQRNHGQPPKQQKKPFDLKKAHWDMD